MKEIYSNVNIVGGGLIGVATAISLCKLGYDVTILEKNPTYQFGNNAFDKRTVAISEGTKLFLNKINVWNELSKYAEPIHRIQIIDRASTNKLIFDNKRRNSNLGYIVKNKKLLDVLYRKLLSERKIKILNNTLISRIQIYDQKIYLETNKHKILSDLNIAADGKNSQIRDILKTNFYKKNYNKKAIVVNFSHSRNHKNTAYEFFYKDGPLAILPMKSENNKNFSSIVWTNSNEYSDSLNKLSDEKLRIILNDKIDKYIGNVLKIYNKQLFPLSAHLNVKFHDKKTIYLGDSAHSFHPIAGQGWNLGMKDVENLYNICSDYKRLGIEIGNDIFCKKYHNNTFYRAYNLYQITDKLDNFFQQNNYISSLTRSVGINIIQKNSIIKNAISDFAMGFN
tara:strand:- start:1970 stop:3154 length:1185 start_codon:yes stop_codon:yes gene_type:complete